MFLRSLRSRLPKKIPRGICEGAVAQLGERLPCTQEVRSSILLGSTISLQALFESPHLNRYSDDFDVGFYP